MNSSSHFQGYAQSPRTARTAVTSLLPPESVSEPTSLPLQLSARAQNCLEGLKSSFVVPITSGQIEGDSSARKPAQNPRTARTAGRSLLSPEFSSELTSQPSGLRAPAQNDLETLSSNLVAPYGTPGATYHSMGLEGVTSFARIARRVSIFPEIGTRLTNRVCFARRRVATTLPAITTNP
jgi:hypothetical protein